MLELVIVVVLMGILAATAIPSITAASQTQGIAATRELERRIVHARSRAVSTGEPTGLTISTDGTVTLVRIASSGASPTLAPGPTGATSAAWLLPSAFRGVSIAQITGGDGSGASTQTIWFGFDGSPELRTPSGARTGNFQQDARVTLAGPSAGVVKVLKGSGMVER